MLQHLYELVQRRAEQYPSATALGGEQGLIWRVLDSRQVCDLVDRLAGELADCGVREGDRVVLWVPNHWRTPIYFFAIWKLGAVVVPFDREMNPEAGAQILTAIEPRLVIAGYGERPAWAQEAEITEWWEPGNRDLSGAHRGSRRSGGGFPPVRLGRTDPPPRGEGTDRPAPARGELVEPWKRPAEDLAAIYFTSGTTGTPKGCMISHANLCSQVEALQYTITLDPSCRVGSILPLSHLFELTVGLLYPFSQGAAIHYIPSRRGPDIVRVLSEQHITHMVAVPQFLTTMGEALETQLRARLPGPIYRRLFALAPRLPLGARHTLFWIVHRKIGGQLRFIASGGAALPVETQHLWERIGVRIVQGYGASECSPVIACGAGDGSTPAGSVGKPLRGVEVRLNPEGELLVHGPNVMRGYWKDPERTAEVLKDGWYATGDLANIDGAGNIVLAGRAKDLIVLPSGMKVWPQDVEDVLRADEAVKDAAVVAVPSVSGGARLHAYLLPAGARAEEEDGAIAAIVSRANGRLAQHQRIGTASWWPESDFPRTAIGKVRRNLLPLPDSVQSVKVESVLAADDPAGQAVASVARVNAVRDEQTLAELGLDSFALVELAVELEEKTGKALADGDLSAEMTVAQIRDLLAAAPELAEAGEAAATGGRETLTAEQPFWPYTWGRIFRGLSLPFDLLYRVSVPETIVLGAGHLAHLPRRTIFAGTHHSFADLPLIRAGLAKTPAKHLVSRLIVAISSSEFAKAGPLANYGRLAFGLYPLRQYGEQDVSMRRLARLARAGNTVLIFPQGQHAKPERERLGDPSVNFRTGVAHLAEALEAAVVPFGIAGTDIVMPPEREDFHGRIIAGVPVSITRAPLAIAFGEPLTLEPGESLQDFTARLQQASFALTRRAEAEIENKE